MRIYFAGMEGSQYVQLWDLIDPEESTRQAFVSYYHLRRQNQNTIQNAKLLKSLKAKGARITIDSGTFTFMMQAMRQGKAKQVRAMLKDFLFEYVDWAKRMQQYFDFMVELDLQHVISIEEVLRYRKYFFDQGLGHKLWICHHAYDGWESFERMIDQCAPENGGSGYCGIEGLNLKSNKVLDYDRHARYAYEKGICIHAFASTRVPFLTDFPLASADSTSYNSVARYGQTMVFDPVTLGTKTVQRHTVEGTSLAVLERSRAWMKGFGGRKAPREYRDQQYITAMRAFMDMEKAVTDLWKSRGIDWEAIEQMHEERRRGESK